MNTIDIDLKIERSPKLAFGKKICNWLGLKLVKIGRNAWRYVDSGYYLLPKANEMMFMRLSTWRYGNPLSYILHDGITVNGGIFAYSCEEELFYYSFLIAKQLCARIGLNWITMDNPLFHKSIAEADIWLDLNGHAAWKK